MKSSLQTLQRIQKFNIDEQRKILAELQTNEEKLQSGLERLNTEYEREKEFASAHPGTGDFGAYTKRYLQYREEQKTLDEIGTNAYIKRKKQ